MRTDPAANSQVTREYQHTNRRVTNITPHPRFTSCRFQLLLFDEQIEKQVLLPVDIYSAISTLRMSCPSQPPGAHERTLIITAGSGQLHTVVGRVGHGKRGRKRCAPESAAAITPTKYISADIKAAPAPKETSTLRCPERSARAHTEMLITNPSSPTNLTILVVSLSIINNAAVSSSPTTKRTDERHFPVLEFQIDVIAAHSVRRLVGPRWSPV